MGKWMSMRIRLAPIMDRVSNLLSQMTIEEKTCQLATLMEVNVS